MSHLSRAQGDGGAQNRTPMILCLLREGALSDEFVLGLVMGVITLAYSSYKLMRKYKCDYEYEGMFWLQNGSSLTL